MAHILSQIDDRNELAWHILDSRLMHDPDLADLVARGARGDGQHSSLLRAMIVHPDEPIVEPVKSSTPLPLQLPAGPYRFRPMSRREQMKANPFMLPKAVQRSTAQKERACLRSAVLTDEAARLYRCMAYAMQAYGVVMDGHMTIAWQEFRIRNHEHATKVLTEFNARMGKWLGVDAIGRKRKGVSLSMSGVGEKYFYAYIHEHASNHGFHTHQLIGITDGKARAYAERAVQVLERLTGVTKAPASAVVFTPGTVRDGLRLICLVSRRMKWSGAGFGSDTWRKT